MGRKSLALTELNLTQLKSFCTAKKAINKMKRQPTEWENIFANHVSDEAHPHPGTESHHLECLVLFEQEGPHFHFALSPSDSVAFPDTESFFLSRAPPTPSDPPDPITSLLFHFHP